MILLAVAAEKIAFLSYAFWKNLHLASEPLVSRLAVQADEALSAWQEARCQLVERQYTEAKDEGAQSADKWI